MTERGEKSISEIMGELDERTMSVFRCPVNPWRQMNKKEFAFRFDAADSSETLFLHNLMLFLKRLLATSRVVAWVW